MATRVQKLVRVLHRILAHLCQREARPDSHRQLQLFEYLFIICFNEVCHAMHVSLFSNRPDHRSLTSDPWISQDRVWQTTFGPLWQAFACDNSVGFDKLPDDRV